MRNGRAVFAASIRRSRKSSSRISSARPFFMYASCSFTMWGRVSNRSDGLKPARWLVPLLTLLHGILIQQPHELAGVGRGRDIALYQIRSLIFSAVHFLVIVHILPQRCALQRYAGKNSP